MAITTTTTATGSTTNLSFVRLPSLPHNTPIPSILPFPNSNSNSNSNSPHHHHHSSRHLQVRKLLAATWDRLCSLPVLPLTAAAFPFFLDPKDALAVGGEFGILEGRTVALIHPIVMSGLFVYTLWAGYLGWQWRRVRTIQDEINDLKKQLKPSTPTPVTVTPGGGGSGSGAPDAAAPSSPPSPVELKIQQLTEERKELIKGGFRDRHFNAGSILLGFGVFESVGGGVNTWFRTGKLFPGPHLFAGAAITVLWAAAAALVPLMQKGSETARNLHIALNVLNMLLFIWQIPTGIDIVFKVFEFTKWP